MVIYREGDFFLFYKQLGLVLQKEEEEKHIQGQEGMAPTTGNELKVSCVKSVTQSVDCTEEKHTKTASLKCGKAKKLHT